ncbi:MAG: hypothetical protein M9899_09620 [Bdellovibrionaceae bacterium]|nr:hypothetical protein [Pseudobdellovibrionaceae bacterium]
MIIGSRKSDLAVIQAQSIAEVLQLQNPHLQIQFFQRPSMGDLNLDIDLNKTGSKGVFTADFVEHLQKGDCDVVVHSWKDLPIDSHPEFKVLSGPYREDQRDILFLKRASDKKSHLKILTSSPRREFQLQENLKDLLPFQAEISFQSIRGNIPTRFKKYLDSDADGFVVAKAAVDRLMGASSESYAEIQKQIQNVFSQCLWMVLPLSEFPTAAAQGALALEVPVQSSILPTLKKISNLQVAECVELERQTHKSYGGGCHQAMGFSALALSEGILFFTSGQDEGLNFKTQEWRPKRNLPARFQLQEIFLSSTVKVQRTTTPPVSFKADHYSECVISRFEAFPKDLGANPNAVIWAAGTKTWKKLAAQGTWVHGSLDGLGLDHKPEFWFLKSYSKYWFTHAEASSEHLGDFTKVPMYKVNYTLEAGDLENKKIFFWSSAELFHKAWKLNSAALKPALHVCGLGRTSWAIKSLIPDAQMYYALDEQEFLQRALL